MKYLDLIQSIFKRIENNPTAIKLYDDALTLIRGSAEENLEVSLKLSQELRGYCKEAIEKSSENVFGLVDVNKKTLLFEAPHLFDSYMQYIEFNRKPKEKFYLPRRAKILHIVNHLQDLVDDKLDELGISEPVRVGKTTLVLFFLTWIIGREPELSNLYSAYSDSITKAFYGGILEIIKDPHTYAWQDVFPDVKIQSTYADAQTVNIGRRKRYPSLTCRSLYGTLNGACDCKGYLVADDLISGIEEALNKDRLVSAWLKVENNLLTRAKEGAKILWIGTRWSMIDPIGLRRELLENDSHFKNRRAHFINVPALNENEESNFDYLYGVGFSTDFYLQKRASFERNGDLASWLSLYMGEPIERDGALFSPTDMLFYNGVLPDGEPDNIFMACDVAFGGGDYVSAPVAYQFGDKCFIHDWVFDNGDKFVTRPKIISLILKHKIQRARFEKNNGGGEYQEYVEDVLKTNHDYRLNITSMFAPSNKRKEERIFDKAPEIKECYFLEEGKRSKEYSIAINNLYSFKIVGKNKFDDAPDSMAMLVDMKNKKFDYRVAIVPRLF